MYRCTIPALSALFRFVLGNALLFACCATSYGQQKDQPAFARDSVISRSRELTEGGSPEAAVALLRQALQSGGPSENRAELHAELGSALAVLQEFDSAVSHYERAIGMADASSARSRALRLTLGDVHYFDRSDFTAAEKWLISAWEAYRQAGDTASREFGRSNHILASLNNQKGDYERALLYCNKAYSVFMHPRVGDRVYAFNSRILLANIHYNRGQYREAGHLYATLLHQAEADPAGYGNSLPTVYINYSALLTESGDFGRASLLLRRALSASLKTEVPNSRLLSYLYLNLAPIYEQRGMYDSASHWHRACIELRRAHYGPGHIETHQAYRLYGEFQERIQRYDSALLYYQEALKSLFPDFIPESVYDNPKYEWEYRDDIFYIIFFKARAMCRRFFERGDMRDLESALELYREAYRLIDLARNSDYYEESKLDIPQVFASELRSSVHCAYTMHRLRPESGALNLCFEWIEKNKYALLLQSLERAGALTSLGIPDSVRHLEQLLNARIADLQRQLRPTNDNPVDADEQTELQARLFSVSRERDLLVAGMAADYANYYQLKFGGELPGLDRLKETLLGEDQMLIQFFTGDSLLYVLSASRAGTALDAVPLSREFHIRFEEFLDQLATGGDPGNPAGSFRHFCKSGHYLYEKLIQPALDGVAGRLKRLKQITVIPDSWLSSLPFEVLLTGPADTTNVNYRELPYLMKKAEIGYAYSAQLLYRAATSAAPARQGTMLAMSFSGGEGTATGVPERSESRELPHSAAELRSIARHLRRGDYYHGPEATETKFKAMAPKAGLLHLAIHGVADTINALNSRLEFRGPGDETDDGYLYSYELYDLDLSRLRLAVLSACETGVGRQYTGEGIFSIARAFAYAGCPALVMSLWSVNDRSSAQLMDGFYKHLAAGRTATASLHRAKMEFLESADEYGAHPSRWAAFIAINAEVRATPLNPAYLRAAAGLLVLLSAFLIHRIMKRTR
jgi:CHAT domain-containing protein